MVTVTVVTSSSSKIRPGELNLVADSAKERFNLLLDALLVYILYKVEFLCNPLRRMKAAGDEKSSGVESGGRNY